MNFYSIFIIINIISIIISRGAAIICVVGVLHKHDKIVLGGKRLTFFENQVASKNVKSVSDEIHAV